jgi:hypothetical protein
MGNEHFDRDKVLKEHQKGTIRRMEGCKVILAVQDTTSLNYDTHEKMEGLGYISDKTKGINIHSCIAVTAEGLTLGVLDQMHYNRPEPKDTSLTKEQRKNRAIEDKESVRWLDMLERVNREIPEGIKVINVCDREGDMYELFNKAAQNGWFFLIRIIQNRMTVENERIFDKIRLKRIDGKVTVVVPRDSRRNLKEREAVLDIRHKEFEIKKPKILEKNKELALSLRVNVIYVKEENAPKGCDPIEWFLMTNESVESWEDAYEKVGYYIQRWKIERFHFVLKSGCRVEKLQERSVEATASLVLMYSIIAIFILNLTYIARLNPELPCTILFDKDEWEILYCAANRTKIPPAKPYTIEDAVKYVGWMGGPIRAPSDGPPGVKTVWRGLQKLYTLLDYRELFDIVGQV